MQVRCDMSTSRRKGSAAMTDYSLRVFEPEARGGEPSLAEVLQALPADVAMRLAVPVAQSPGREPARATP